MEAIENCAFQSDQILQHWKVHTGGNVIAVPRQLLSEPGKTYEPLDKVALVNAIFETV